MKRITLSKYEKETIILGNEKDDFYQIYTFNTDLRRRLSSFAKRYPALCQLKEINQEGGHTFVIAKDHLMIQTIKPSTRNNYGGKNDGKEERNL